MFHGPSPCRHTTVASDNGAPNWSRTTPSTRFPTGNRSVSSPGTYFTTNDSATSSRSGGALTAIHARSEGGGGTSLTRPSAPVVAATSCSIHARPDSGEYDAGPVSSTRAPLTAVPAGSTTSRETGAGALASVIRTGAA